MIGDSLMRLAAALGLSFFLSGCASFGSDVGTVWSFGDLTKVGGVAAKAEGAPKIVPTPAGPAIAFDGVKDALFVDTHPLAGATTWTIDAIFRPDGGAFEQRWLHLAEVDPKTEAETGTRFLFEIRVKDDRWYLDAFTVGDGYKMTLIDPSKTFALGRWYHVAMTYDGKMFRSYVDGVEQGAAAIDFKPQGQGHSSVGVRINRVNYFHGAVQNVRFTPKALPLEEISKVPAGLNPAGK